MDSCLASIFTARFMALISWIHKQNGGSYGITKSTIKTLRKANKAVVRFSGGTAIFKFVYYVRHAEKHVEYNVSTSL